MDDEGVVPSELRCLSVLVNVRCQGLSRTEQIVSAAPVLSTVLFLPISLFRAWDRPEASLLFLSLDIASGVAVSAWDLGVRLTPAEGITAYQQQDLALGVTASLPLIFVLLTTTAVYLSLLRPYLPNWARGHLATTLYILLILPLVPAALIASLLGSVLLLIYEPQGERVQVGFTSPSDESVHVLLGSISGITTAAYLLTTTLTAHIVVFSPPSRTVFNAAHSRPSWVLPLLAIGLLTRAIETILSLLPSSFTLLLTRQSLHAMSQALLVVALTTAYPPLRRSSRFATVRPRLARLAGFSSGVAASQRARSVYTADGPNKAIGPPIAATFKKLSAEVTREFHKAKEGFAASDTTAPSVRIPRVVYRTPKYRAPVLSFTSSLFSPASLTAQVAGLGGDSAVSPSPTPALRSKSNHHPSTPPLPERNMRRAKKYTGSIYDAKHISVQPHQIAQWPLPSPPPRATHFAAPNRAPRPVHLEDWPVPPMRLPSRPAVNAHSPVDMGGQNGDAQTPTAMDSSPGFSATNSPSSRNFYPGDVRSVTERAPQGIIVRDTPRGITRNSTFAAPMPPQPMERSDSYSRKPVPPLDSVVPNGPVPPRPPRRGERAPQKSLKGEMSTVNQPNLLHPADPAHATPDPAVDPRLDHMVRRETDPLIAIDPDVAALAPNGNRSLDGKAPPGGRASAPSIPSSEASIYTSTERDVSLFFSTPIQSPTASSDLPSPHKASWTYLQGTGLQIVEEADQVRQTDPAGMRSVMASLWRITRDAGVEIDPSRLSLDTRSVYTGLRASQDSLYSSTGSFETVRGRESGGLGDRLQKGDHGSSASQGRYHRGGLV